jgi:hypothetical protein
LISREKISVEILKILPKTWQLCKLSDDTGDNKKRKFSLGIRKFSLGISMAKSKFP